jgi:hypothetical protein
VYPPVYKEKSNMPDLNLSPEEILKQKELRGGVKYDDPSDLNLEPVESELIPGVNVYQEKSESQAIDSSAIPSGTTTVVTEKPQEPNPTTSQESNTREFIEKSPLALGWKNLPLGMLPSKGLFYPENSRIAIRSAEVKEIRQFSMIDEDDMLDIDQKLNMVLDSCCIIKFGDSDSVVSYRDLKQEDRFFVIMAIRDLTFIKGENRIILDGSGRCSTKDCKGMDVIELRTGVLSNYDLDENLMKFYSFDERKFVFPIRRIGKTIKMTVPSIGVTKAISDFVRNSVKKGEELDQSFIKIAPFYFDNWRGLDDFKIKEAMITSSQEWTKEEFSAYFELAEKIKVGTKLQSRVECDACGAGEVTAPIYFPGGFRSLFVISDIFRELF